ncbi:DNA (cytosine-5)-methyltransferase CMT2 [Forsythia ovata]|uniref:Cytosine-specific methyltransferase n=1 Tax=Forsythia ovata TaxID=205694 RepID=A0ABD1WN84_9LAMI
MSSSANADELALSLYVEEVEPVPLKIYVPSCIRRSPRFTTNKYKTPSPARSSFRKPKGLPTLAFSVQERRSPRISASSLTPALISKDDKNVDSGEVGSKKRRRFEEERASEKVKLCLYEKSLSSPRLRCGGIDVNSRGVLSTRCLRSRTVVMHVGNEKEMVDISVNVKGLRSRKIELDLVKTPKASKTRDFESRFSRFQRLSEVENENLKSEVLALCETPSLSDKCLRSTTLKMLVGIEKEVQEKSASKKSICDAMLVDKCLRSSKVEPALDGLAQFSEKRDFEKCDSEVRSEKCLRSRKIEFKLNVDGTVGKKTARIEDCASKNEGSVKKTMESNENKKKQNITCRFIGEPIPEEEARERWGWRYELKSQTKGRSWKLNTGEEDETILNVECHYAQAKVGSCVLNVGDCAYIKGEGKKHVGRVLEFFKTTEGEDYFRVQWFFRAEDTVMKDAAAFHDKRRLFYSTLTNDNVLDCIISKVNIVKIPPVLCVKPNTIQPAAFYYDMEYSVEYSTFRTLSTESFVDNHNSFSSKNADHDYHSVTATPLGVLSNCESLKAELAILDLFSGCGGMSTGLCFGANLSGLNLVTKWAVDYNRSACDSLKLNHPDTKVRNESANDFLELLRRWEELCKSYVCDLDRSLEFELEDIEEGDGNINSQLDKEVSSEEYEVSCLVDICYGDPGERGKRGLHFKVRWKGYDPDEDTWEPIEELSNCQERIWDFVRKGLKSKILPLPGDVDVICGGPPCQGISGYNRHRNVVSPLDDERNHQIVVFMDIVEFLKPKYVLMENVVDIIRFDKASLGRYALSRLVHMKYQARLGTIASGCYGLPQFRLRVFIWGASPSERLPPFPLPTHDVVVKYWPPCEFERNTVAYDEGQPRTLEEAIALQDAISDLPAVTNDETREEMTYEKPPETGFQNYIRSSKDEMVGLVSNREMGSTRSVLYDHRPLQLSKHDYLRVCQIPTRKGANFRDLPGVIVGEDNVARRDPTKEPMMLPTGRPVVPDCVFTFEQGKSKKPYARLWWDETVATVVTFPYIRCQAVLHPEQDRLLTIREFARLQGFPDFYRFCGTVKEKYCQIGNAVSVPVARALGYALGMASRKVSGDEPLMILPPKFSFQQHSADETVVSENRMIVFMSEQ